MEISPSLYQRINKRMELSTIRRRMAYEHKRTPTQREATRLWLQTLAEEFPLALTLTLKQTVQIMTPRGVHRHALTRDDVQRTAQRFIKKLNREVFGKRAADRYGKTLRYIVVMEGERSGKNLHLHFAVGGLPTHCRINQFDSLVCQAKAQVQQTDVQHKVDVMDSGWMEYICKELGSRDTDNVLWNVH